MAKVERNSSINEIINSLSGVTGSMYDENYANSFVGPLDWTVNVSKSIGIVNFSETSGNNISVTVYDNPYSTTTDNILCLTQNDYTTVTYNEKILLDNIYDDTDVSGVVYFSYNGKDYLYDTYYKRYEKVGGSLFGDKSTTPFEIGKFSEIRYIKKSENEYHIRNSLVYGIKTYKAGYSDTAGGSKGIPIYSWFKKDKEIYLGISVALNNTLNNPNSPESEKRFSGYIKYYSDSRVLCNLYLNESAGTRLNTDDIKDKEAAEKAGTTGDNGEEKPVDQYLNYTGSDEFEITGGYADNLYAQDTQELLTFWNQLYGGYNGYYSLKSHQAIIGLPLQFMGNVDMRVGSSTYGKQYMEDILYDMNIAIIKPGGPVLNPAWDSEAQYSDSFDMSIAKSIGKFKAYWDSIQNEGFAGFMKQYIFQMMKGGNARFYSFQSDYTHYTHYVNTLCHMFITFLGIDKKTYRTGSGNIKTYAEYKDDISEIESDGGDGLRKQFGTDNAVYLYYSDEGSALNQSFTNTTGPSGLSSTLQSASDAVKEWGFFLNAAGLERGTGLAKFGTALQDSVGGNSNSLLGRLFGNVTEGVSTILAGNNLSLPEIYMDSDTAVEHSFKVKLVSPYGDPESVFLYVLRPLARLLAFSLPRQYGPNSYQSPFIVQAFSKGQFNCQLGIVTNLSISRCGQGGESHTINHIPTELEVSITIQDMYEKVFLSNEYFGNSAGKALIGAFIDKVTNSDAGTGITQFFSTSKAASLLFNNVGLIDFMASFCGFNLNMPSFMSGWTLIWNMMKSRTSEYASYSQNDGWAFPQWEKALNDAYNDAVTNLSTVMTVTN